MNIRVLISLVPFVLAFISVLLALWDHDISRAGAWGSATLGWMCAAMNAMENER